MKYRKQPKPGIGIVTYDCPQQVRWWARQLGRWRGAKHDFVAVISTSDNHKIDSNGFDVMRGQNLGVAHTKNRALRYLYAAGCDPIILAEDDCQLSYDVIEKLCCARKRGFDHLMLGPVNESPTWELTGKAAGVPGLSFYEYRRTRDPQDTPGVVSMVSRRAVDRCGGLDGRFIGRGHAHGEWTARIERRFPNPLGSPFWHLDVGSGLYCLPPVVRNVTHDPKQIARNREIREMLEMQPDKQPNLDYLASAPARREPISVCIALKDRAETLTRCLNSVAAWFRSEPEITNEIVIADFGSTDCDPSDELQKRGLRGRVVRVNDYFSRALGLHAAAMQASNPLLFFLDADMLMGKSIGETIRRLVFQGQCFFPVVWSLHQNGGGYWRHTGYGMLAIHADDYRVVGGWNTKIRRWGGEDDDIHWHAKKRGLKIERFCLSTLVHQWHSDDSDYKEKHIDPAIKRQRRRPWQPPDKRGAVLPPLSGAA